MGKLFVAPVLSGPPYRDPFHSGCDLVRPLALQGYFVDNDTLVGPHATPIQISPGPLTVTSRDEPWDTPKSVEMLPLLAHGPAGFIESYLPGLPEFITFGIRVLGTPVAADDYVAIELDATLIPVRIAHTHLAEINDRQIELQLHLRACFVSCEVNHLFRIVQPPQLALFFENFDFTICGSLAIVLQSPFSDQAWIQAGGKYSHWDIDLAHAHALQAAAFLGSLFRVRWRLSTNAISLHLGSPG
jgi:hypothetical protein